MNKYKNNIYRKKAINLPKDRPISLGIMNDSLNISHFLICKNTPSLIYVYYGEAELLISNKLFKISKGDLIFVNAFEYHKYIPLPNTPFNLSIIDFNPEMFKLQNQSYKLNEKNIEDFINQKIFFPVRFSKDVYWQKKLIDQIEFITVEIQKNPTNNSYLLFSFLNQLFYLTSYYNAFKKGHYYLKRVEKILLLDEVIDFIEKNYVHNDCPKLVCERFRTTQRQMTALFQEYYDMDFTKYLNKFRIEKSLRLYWDSNLLTNQISKSVGFNNTCYYNELFKLIYDISPSDYRDEISQLPANTLPKGWGDICFGDIDLKGSTSYENGTVRIKGASYNIPHLNDVWHCAYKAFKDDFSFKCKLNFLHPINPESCAGILLRDNLNQGGKYTALSIFENKGFVIRKFNAKSKSQMNTYFHFETTSICFWVQKSNNKLTVSISEDNQIWKEVFSEHSSPTKETTYLCLTTASRDENRLSLAEFNVLESSQ